MSALILDGKWLSACFQAEIKRRVAELLPQAGREPGLGVILVGDNPASHTYVANKEKIARNCGLKTFDRRLPVHATMNQVKDAIDAFNQDSAVDGILLQLPLPKQLEQNELLDRIDPRKDADGLHPLNQGLLLRGEADLRPCTPMGSMYLIDLAFAARAGSVAIGDSEFAPGSLGRADLSGLQAVVVGRSLLVGKPVGMMLLERNATVVFAHSKTKDLAQVVGEADIVVAAVGVPELVRGAWVKEGAIVIDVGINRTSEGKLIGDVDFPGAQARAGAVTPVPGGVGPMTVVMLVRNTLRSFERRTSAR